MEIHSNRAAKNAYQTTENMLFTGTPNHMQKYGITDHERHEQEKHHEDQW